MLGLSPHSHESKGRGGNTETTKFNQGYVHRRVPFHAKHALSYDAREPNNVLSPLS